MNAYELNKDQLRQDFRDEIDSIYEETQIGSIAFAPSRVLEELNPIAFECGFSDWTDEMGYDFDRPYVCNECGLEYKNFDDAEICCMENE